jgi:REP element-mobilizing transposase RayT
MLENTSKDSLQITHARYLQSGMVYHIISKTLRGQFLLAPKKGVSLLCGGVVAMARQNWPEVKLYGFAFMSNHIHLMVSGRGNEVSSFVGFIKREISRRLGQRYKLPGTFWHQRFVATALPTEESQVKCLKYILSQGVKEDLVERPEHWPGLHCAKYLTTGLRIKAEWLDATSYHRAKTIQSRQARKKRLNKSDFIQRLDLTVDALPCWEHLSIEARRIDASALVCEIVTEEAERRKREGKTVVGRKAVRSMSIVVCTKPLLPPWWRERRRQLTAWAKRYHECTRAYVSEYWCFQRGYRDACAALMKARGQGGFPKHCWSPSFYQL